MLHLSGGVPIAWVVLSIPYLVWYVTRKTVNVNYGKESTPTRLAPTNPWPSNKVLFALVALGLVAAIYISQVNKVTTGDFSKDVAECYKLGSNERMELCVKNVKAQYQKAISPSEIEIKNTIDQGQFRISVQMVNKSMLRVSNIKLKNIILNYDKKTKKCLTDVIDTEYFDLEIQILPGDTVFHSIDSATPENACYRVEVVSASGY